MADRASDSPLTFAELAAIKTYVTEPDCDPEVLAQVISAGFYLTAEDRPHTEDRLSPLMLSHVTQQAAAHPGLPGHVFTTMLHRLESPDDTISIALWLHRLNMVCAALRNPSCPGSVLMAAVLSPIIALTQAALANPACPEDVKVAAALDPKPVPAWPAT